MGVSLVVHGDEFTALGLVDGISKFEQAMQEHFEVKLRGRLSEAPEDLKEMKILNRVAKIDEAGLHYEADPRHRELLVAGLGAECCGPVGTPGEKQNLEKEDDEAEE